MSRAFPNTQSANWRLTQVSIRAQTTFAAGTMTPSWDPARPSSTLVVLATGTGSRTLRLAWASAKDHQHREQGPPPSLLHQGDLALRPLVIFSAMTMRTTATHLTKNLILQPTALPQRLVVRELVACTGRRGTTTTGLAVRSATAQSAATALSAPREQLVRWDVPFVILSMVSFFRLSLRRPEGRQFTKQFAKTTLSLEFVRK